ncbi:hypothetical protein [Roseimicrobium sp. ORNL1]|uniref:hypothetical protein n=1 Tax=Roseimicrobium sp. ORNL1 TaxID=2711231 RepID=UPI0013E1AD32|nr:hypothetical protein [Roseimicrobium sp. ORNL1]QIF02099.1 hypothetical protein G5S37_11330 [Roseimicrobium sp. ORNL1]
MLDPLLILLAITWLVSGFMAYGHVLMATVSWLDRKWPDPAGLSQDLQTGWKCGLLSLGCVVTVLIIILILTCSNHPLTEFSVTAVMEWSKHFKTAFILTSLPAVIAILPTGVCWFWERGLRARGIRGDALI